MKSMLVCVLLLGSSVQAQRNWTTMPNVIGLARKDAEAALKKAKLVEFHVTTTSGGFPNVVRWQIPRAGSRVFVNADVALVITTGGK